MKSDFVKVAKMTLISSISCCVATALQSEISPLSVAAKAATESANTQAPPANNPNDEQLIRKGADVFVKALAAGDASSIAIMCAQECCYTGTNGETFNGRDAIKKMYEQNFADSGAQPVALAISKISFPSNDVAIEEGRISSAKSYSTSTYSIVHIKKDGIWKMLRISEYINSVVPSEVLKNLDWMIGDWTLHGANKDAYLSVSAINHGNFLVMRFSDGEGSATSAQMQIIGWNAKTRDIVSWNFGHEGGTGYGHWRQDGNTWFITTRGTTHDGADSTADYIIKHPDSSHFSWESAGRSLNGLKLPNMGIVDATRLQPDSK